MKANKQVRKNLNFVLSKLIIHLRRILVPSMIGRVKRESGVNPEHFPML